MKSLARALGNAVATVIVLPSILSLRLRGLLLGRDRALMGSSEFWSLIPGVLGQYLRRAFCRFALASCSRTASIGFGTLFSKQAAVIGERVYLGPGCHLGWAEIGDDALLAAGVHVPSGGETHGFARLDVPIRDQPGTLRRVRIGRGAWIGSAAIVLADVGEGTVVAAGSVVVDPLPDNVIAVGVPARVLRRRDESSSVGTSST